MTYKLVIFDFDGTLADSAGWMRSVINQVARRFRFREVTEPQFESLRGKTTREIMAELGVSSWKLPFIARHMRKLLAADAHRIALFPGVEAMLAELVNAGITVAVVSSNSEPNVRAILGPENALRVRHYACGAGLFGKARKFKQVLGRAGVSAAEALSIGDEVRDIEAARSVGITPAVVSWGYATPELLRAHAPAAMFERVADIGPLLFATAR